MARRPRKTAINQNRPAAMLGNAHVGASLTEPDLASWQPYAGSPDADLLDDLGMLASRSRDMARNNGLAGGYHQTLRDNVIGAQLRLSAKPEYKLLGWSAEEARAWANGTEAEFRSFSDTTECDAARSLNLLGLTIQAFSGAMLNGDHIGIPLWLPRPDAKWSTRILLVEADRMDTPPHLSHRLDIRRGVHQDRYGAPLGYYINKTHPGDQYALRHGWAAPDQWQYIPAFTPWGRRRVIHLHDKERTGQSRGKPVVASVMREFRMAGKYQTTELQAAIANSLIAAFIESNLDSATTAAMLGNSAEGYNQSTQGMPVRMQGASIINLPFGAKLSSFIPGRPNAGFEAFMLASLRNIAAGLNVPYELLLKDFSKTNYSSARAAMLEAWRYFNGRRRWLMDYWLRPIYELWLEEAVDARRVVAPDYYANRYAYSRCRFIFSGRGWVDPVKEAQAALLRMEGGLSTLEAECAEQGTDYEEVLEQQAHEMALRKELGLDAPAGSPGAVYAQPGQRDPEPTQDNQTAALPEATVSAALVGLSESVRALAAVPAPVIQFPQPRAVKRVPVRDPENGKIVEVHEIPEEVEGVDDED